MKKNITDILTNKTSLEHSKSVIDDLEREASFNRGFYYYNQQSYFLFEPKSKSFTRNGEAINAWLSTGIHNGSNNTDLFSVNNSNNNSPTLLNKNNRLGVTFNGNYMKQNKLGYAHGKIVNLYIVYELKNRRVDNPDFTVQNGLSGPVKITKNANTSHYKYEGYGICFDGESSFSFGNRIDAKNVIIFGVNTSNSSHSTNKTQNIYVLGKDFVQGINNTTIYAEKIHKTNFIEQSKKFVLPLHYNGHNSYLFVNGTQELKIKSSINYLDRNLFCVGNISSDWSLTNGTKTGLYGNVYEFAIDYVTLSGVRTIYDIHRYLMKKKIYKMLNLIKKNNIINCFSTISLWILFIVKKSRMCCKKSNY